MTKYRKGEEHKCDDTCKINHTTDFARENKLPTGSKVNSTLESSEKAYKEQLKRDVETEKFKNKQKVILRKPEVKNVKAVSPIKIAKDITSQMADLTTIKSNPANIEVIWKIIDVIELIDNSRETNKILEKTLIMLRKLQKDIAN